MRYILLLTEWATPDSTPAVDQYTLYLKRFYSDYKLPKDEWPPRVSDHYVNLALINHQKVPQSYEMDDFMKSTLHGTIDDLHFDKQTIALEHLFQPKHLVERSSLQLRNQLLRGSMNHQFRTIQQSFPSAAERAKQVRRLLQLCTSQSDTQKAVLTNQLQPLSYAQPSVGSLSNDKGLKVLLDGAPGVGKTTFCHIACKSWADGKVFTDFKLMVYVPLRDDQVANCKEIDDLFCYGPKALRQRVARELDDTDGENALLVFDGWDELSPQQRGKNSLLCKIIIGRILPRCSILITSRPYASQWLRKPDVTNRHVEIFGFTEQQVGECIHNMLGQVSPAAAKALLDKLEVRSDLKTLCYVPTNLAMVIYIYTRSFELPDTLTGIYDAFATNALLRYLQEYDTSTEPILHLTSRDALPTDVQEMYKAICQVAYHGLLQDKMVFSKEDLQAYHSQLTTSSNTLGLITAFKGFTETGVDLKYQFLHLTIQEFLAAEALSREPPEVQTKFVVDHLHDIRYRTMFRFLFGKCSLDSMEVVLRFLFLTSVNGRDRERLLFLCHMLYEAHDPEFYRAVGRKIPLETLSLKFPYDVTLFDTMVIGKFLSQATVQVKCLDLYDTTLTRQKLALLTDNLSSDSIQMSVEELLLETGNCSISEVAPFLQHPIFSKVVSLKINPPTAPNITAMFCMSIASMPKLSRVALFLRSPTSLDKAVLPSATEDVHLAIISALAELSQNPGINDLKIFVNSATMPRLLNEASAVALIEMIQKCATAMSLEIDGAIFGESFMEHFCDYLATSSKIKKLRIFEKPPSYRRSENTDDGRITGRKAQTFFAALKQNESVEFLELKSCKLMFADPAASTAMEEMLRTNSTLRSLHLGGCKINTPVAFALSEAMHVNQSLTDLALNEVEEGISAVLSSLATSQCDIHTLKLSNCQLSNTDEPFIGAILARNTLKSLDLTSNYLGPDAIANLLSTLKDNISLEKLVLSDSKCLGEGDTEAIPTVMEAALSKNHTLKVLQLDHCSLPYPAVEAIANALASGSGLEDLNMEGSKLSPLGVRKIFIALQTNNTLKKLIMRDDITLDSAIANDLNRMVAHNSSLMALTIKFNSIFGIAEGFVEALRTNMSLTKLGINGLDIAQLNKVNFDRIKKRMTIIAIGAH